MKLYQTDFTYDHPWSTVTLAYFLRYPNPHARHVLASDVIDRYVDEQGCLHSTRLLLKRGKLPAWGARILNINETYIIEESIVDPKSLEMRTVSKNLDHTRVLKVIESQTMTVAQTGQSDIEKTQVQTEVRTISKVPSFVGSKIEYLGVAKFRENFEKSKLGMQVVLEALNKREGPLATGARLGLGLGQRWRSVREWQARMNV
ncbi:Protein ups1 homolog [Taphrina deformans PYCC 5710]|uniref:Protein ups1 homolog n=1 Tax=Taphrina deformans (strain PYCC 5710 / ATCC 11124 / CBS 356.35 / IMI 108563 / JCM 9778 / NBRC 8474) TaxID=1097556 RepID=R4X9K1_TAPDE|nr:Protein ups1 homolog [Taphrina deformans PYCC 5710]|eukprot:CCG82085.1 Protein ups1 homolog [Taphrina deformans PYCC 5710]